MKRRQFLWSSLLFVAGCTTATRQPERNRSQTAANCPDPLRLAITDIKGLEQLQAEFGAFKSALADVLGRNVEFFSVENYVAASPALLSGRVDLVLAGPSEYVLLHARAQAIPLIALTRPDYYSVISVRADSGIKSLKQLKGKTIAMRTAGSTAGHLGSTKLLVDVGLNPQSDFRTVMTGDRGLEALQNGEVDAWADSNIRRTQFLREAGLSESAVPIVARGTDLPSDVFAANSQLDPACLEEVRSLMLAAQDQLLKGILASAANEKYASSEMVAAKDSDYDPIREAYRAIGQDDYL
ncbi:phosphate/phosphite/phosphonate ABC transporter substrate-binding protein [Oxynema aestuarii]|uniref:Phosphate/phosphite/phosphonate ABC transporter substrate-binding protein n=1 Tax=Oxynema aestuarii AP17 TaxID=2064643 RepID=A0A6H1U1M7_9CYAN|nr:phosphate/phosphite/phosphonate ABC transporter substrate-binding protein [Oxynema aestuarii]QIZ72778.1 phosphate/phosphite/phosphonate ABC transporter substrate-binding protein [Oxynema aestuarii AP17]RMH75719.1 MAG: phosphate/phosphite/phosphonate ABC transporter substrate-binding protein [Cyanobacteria bacterium J007]